MIISSSTIFMSMAVAWPTTHPNSSSHLCVISAGKGSTPLKWWWGIVSLWRKYCSEENELGQRQFIPSEKTCRSLQFLRLSSPSWSRKEHITSCRELWRTDCTSLFVFYFLRKCRDGDHLICGEAVYFYFHPSFGPKNTLQLLFMPFFIQIWWLHPHFK